jgi:peptidoglycan/LPS O-acetylase OafA/YrhL
MALSSRFALSTTAVLGGGFLAVSAMTFTASTVDWLAFGVSAAFALAGTAGAVLARRTHQKLAHGSLAVVGLWSLVSALVFTGFSDTTQTWLVFANALALAAVALVDLIAHEATTERVVHELEVRTTSPVAVTTPEHITV